MLQQMLNIKEQTTFNPVAAVETRATDIAGQSIAKRLQIIQDRNYRAGQEVGEQAGKLSGKRVDFNQALDNFGDGLKSLKIGYGFDADGNIKLDYKRSPIRNVEPVKGMLDNLVKELETAYKTDAESLHDMKLYIDEEIDFGKLKKGLQGKAENLMKTLRHDIDQTLDSNFPAYKKANDAYHETQTILDNFKSTTGRLTNDQVNIDFTSPQLASSIGTTIRRLTGNAQSRGKYAKLLKDLDKQVAKYGVNFDDDLALQAAFANDLDNMFGASAATSFRGDQGANAVAETLIDIKTSNSLGLLRRGLNTVSGKSPERITQDKFDAVRKLLQRQYGIYAETPKRSVEGADIYARDAN